MTPDEAKARLATTWVASRAFVSRHRIAVGVSAGVLAVLVLLFVWLADRLPISQALEPLPNRAIILLDNQGKPFARRGAYKEA
ncbi:MAG: hypothetical protein B7Y78_14215, partial [Caulobacter sp. 35-67-4]